MAATGLDTSDTTVAWMVGEWSEDAGSDSMEPLLAFEGVPWLIRVGVAKVVTMNQTITLEEGGGVLVIVTKTTFKTTTVRLSLKTGKGDSSSEATDSKAAPKQMPKLDFFDSDLAVTVTAGKVQIDVKNEETKTERCLTHERLQDGRRRFTLHAKRAGKEVRMVKLMKRR